MIPSITTLDPVTSRPDIKVILARGGCECSLLTLAPGDRMPPLDARHTDAQLLFVLKGEVTVHDGVVSTLLAKEEALLLPAVQERTVTAHPGSGARLLAVRLPHRPDLGQVTVLGN